MDITAIHNETQLAAVLELCYGILGQHLRDIDGYRYEEWLARLEKHSFLLLYAHENGKPIAAVLGRPENADSLVMGFAACDEAYRKRGITRMLTQLFEANAKEAGFKYITLGADKAAESFYEKCGYVCINELHGQKIYQKVLQ